VSVFLFTLFAGTENRTRRGPGNHGSTWRKDWENRGFPRSEIA